MPEIYFSKRFTKNLRKLNRSGSFNDVKLEKILELLARGLPLEQNHKDHQLSGNMQSLRECHVENDMLIVYEIFKSENRIKMIDIGSHSDLFE